MKDWEREWAEKIINKLDASFLLYFVCANHIGSWWDVNYFEIALLTLGFDWILDTVETVMSEHANLNFFK